MKIRNAVLQFAVMFAALVLDCLFGAGGISLSNSLRNEHSDAAVFIGFVVFMVTVIVFWFLIFLIFFNFYKRMKRLFQMGGILMLLLTLMTSMTGCVETINAGNVGIKFNKAGDERGVSKMQEVSGWVWYNPIMTDVIEIPVTIQTATYNPFPVTVKGSEFQVHPIVNYHLNPDKAGFMYGTFRKDLDAIEDGYLYTSVLESCRSATDGFSADSMVNSRTSYETAVRQHLDKEIGRYGFVVDQVTSNLTLPQGLKDRIDARNESIQNAQLAQNQALQATEQAKVQVAEAKGKADALRIEADGKAYANQKVQQSLTPMLLEQQRIQKWNGILPQQILGSNTSLLMGMK